MCLQILAKAGRTFLPGSKEHRQEPGPRQAEDSTRPRPEPQVLKGQPLTSWDRALQGMVGPRASSLPAKGNRRPWVSVTTMAQPCTVPLTKPRMCPKARWRVSGSLRANWTLQPTVLGFHGTELSNRETIVTDNLASSQWKLCISVGNKARAKKRKTLKPAGGARWGEGPAGLCLKSRGC